MRANAFWAEMSACEHFVQIYESEEVFMEFWQASFAHICAAHSKILGD